MCSGMADFTNTGRGDRVGRGGIPKGVCAYCTLPATRFDPFSGAGVCAVDFNLLTGALDFRSARAGGSGTVGATPLGLGVYMLHMTREEAEVWVQMVEAQFGFTPVIEIPKH